MNKQKGIAPIFIILLIALTIGGYLLYQKQTRPVVVSQVTQPYPSFNETANPDSIAADWKTYTSNRFPYTFKYPPLYIVQESFDPNGNIYSTTITNTDSKLFASGAKNVSNKDVFYMIIRNPSSDILPEWPDAQKSKISDYLIDGQYGIKYSQNDVIVLFKNKEYVFHLLSTNSQFKSDFDQILSTFKFLDQNQVTGCTNTYRDLQEALKNPQQVCYLDLSNKNLIELPKEVLQFSNLKSLYLNFNKITTLPEEIKNLKNLTSIDLTGNPITDSEVEKIRRLLPKANIGVIKPMNLP